MTLPMYAKLLTPPVYNTLNTGQVAESLKKYHLLTERHIQAMWLEQKYFRSLVTSDGQIISVISPGIWNSGPGPDFFKAHLKIGNCEVRGDIELHLSEDGWYQHKHHLDSNYNNVILHISYWSPKQPRLLLTANGNKIPTTSLDSSLTIPEGRILNLIDLDLYPYIHFSGTGTCARALFQTLSERKLITFFQSAALWRLKQKHSALMARFDQPVCDVRLGIAMVLGYKHNTEAFAQLYSQMTTQKFASQKHCFAFALGQCGFFQSKYQTKWHLSAYYQELRAIYMSLEASISMPKLIIKQNKIRPPSHPIRRLAALAKLVSDNTLHTIHNDILTLWENSWKTLINTKELKKFQKQLNELLPTYLDDYWQHHYAFEIEAQIRPMALIGSDLKQEMIINVFLPLLYTHVAENHEELDALIRLYASFPSPNTHKTKYLSHRFFGATAASKVLKSTDIQQGAYQLHKDFCIHFEASCQGCPFVDRYHQIFKK